MSKSHSQRQTHEPEVIEEFEWEDLDAVRAMCGERDANLRAVESRFQVTLHPRGNRIRVIGPRTSVDEAGRMLENLYAAAMGGDPLQPILHEHTPDKAPVRPVSDSTKIEDAPPDEVVLVTYKNKRLGPKTEGQRAYVNAIHRHDVVFGIGPAGTGKTYLAVLLGVQQLLAGQVTRMILTRPAVEAGERLGFLPGDLAEKVNPYLRPLYDALHDMLPFDRVRNMLDNGIIEVAPLAFMRGRTLNNAFVILDEAQNTTPEQMKMFLTRVGEGSRVVVTGDVTQTDLPQRQQSGLEHAASVLRNVREIAFIQFTHADVVRHPIVQQIIDAYARDAEQQHQLDLKLDSEAGR